MRKSTKKTHKTLDHLISQMTENLDKVTFKYKPLKWADNSTSNIMGCVNKSS